MSQQEIDAIGHQLINKFALPVSRNMLVQATAQALGNASHNATFAQQQQNVIINTNTAMSAGIIHAIGAAYAKK